jgi:hypothetical protein
MGGGIRRPDGGRASRPKLTGRMGRGVGRRDGGVGRVSARGRQHGRSSRPGSDPWHPGSISTAPSPGRSSWEPATKRPGDDGTTAGSLRPREGGGSSPRPMRPGSGRAGWWPGSRRREGSGPSRSGRARRPGPPPRSPALHLRCEHGRPHPPPLQVAEQMRPAFGALPEAVLDGDELLRPIRPDSDHHQQAEPVLLAQPCVHVHAVGPRRRRPPPRDPATATPRSRSPTRPSAG